MSKTYSQLMQEVDALKAKAEAVRRKELSGVVDRIKEAIAFYELTAGDLGLVAGAKVKAKTRPSGKANGAAVVKFRDAEGHTWSGRGPRPGWFKQALAAGQSPEQLLASSGSAPAPARKRAAGRKRVKPAAKYKDASGKTWSGRGRKPAWFVEAIKAGQTAESMLI